MAKPNARDRAVTKTQKAVNQYREPVGVTYREGKPVIFRPGSVPDDPIKQVRQYQLTKGGNLREAVEIEAAIKRYQAGGTLPEFKEEINRIFNCKFWADGK